MIETSGTKRFAVRLSISPTEYERLYRGHAKTVLARATDGRTLQFPALSLRPFLTHDGIHGLFILSVDGANRLLDIRRDEG